MTRARVRLVLALTLACVAQALAAAGGDAPAQSVPVYVGTYAGGGSRGIYRFELDPSSGAATAPVLAGESENPSFLAVHPNGRVLYAVNEVASFGGAPTGAVSAFVINTADGSLTRLDQQPSGGADPCYLAVDRAGRNVLVANYTAGTVAVLPLAVSGRVPTGGRAPRHFAIDASGRFLLVAKEESDSITFFRLDPATGRPSPIGRPLVLSKPVCVLLAAPPR